MPSLSVTGRVALAELIYMNPVHLAWGIGDGVWTSTVPAETGSESGLISEIGRRTVTQIEYVVPDVAGAIVLPTGSFSVSVTPTRYLYFRTDFDFSDAVGAAVREVGLFIRTVTIAGLPEGQKYFTPAQVADPGRLVYLKNYSPIYRLPDTRERFEFVMTF
jgi:hypothetical protein